jgi:hypothetical protein
MNIKYTFLWEPEKDKCRTCVDCHLLCASTEADASLQPEIFLASICISETKHISPAAS